MHLFKISFRVVKFKYAGQNLGQVSHSNSFMNEIFVIKNIINGWCNEYKDIDMTYIEKYRKHDTG